MEMIGAVNAIMGCALVGLFTSLFILAFSWLGLLPMVIIDSKEVDEDEGL